METLLIATLIIVSLSLISSILILIKSKKQDNSMDFTEIEKFITDKLEASNRLIKDEFGRNREEFNRNAQNSREELSNSFKTLANQVRNNINDLTEMQKSQLNNFATKLDQLTKLNDEKFDKLIRTSEEKSDKLRDKVESQLKELANNNETKLEEMRKTVDEKLHDTLEKRLGESFKVVSERLEQVYKGLGDMQELARGVGDLKNVLTNVKTRGTWGEVQLENIIDQILTKEQYDVNISTKKNSNDRVEIAIKLPGREKGTNENVYLPIDAKFPIEDYQRLIEAQENSNLETVAEATKGIERRIKAEAKKIAEKYLDPPFTTDFAILFLPVEGLYAEVLRNVGLAEFVQREYRVTIAGPTTLSALLNSLQMGFRTLAIEKRSSEVWKILSGVKTEFGKFSGVLEKTKKKLQEASNTIDSATVRTRAIERKLRDVEELPSGDEQINLLD